MSQLMISISGVRGVIGEGLTPEIVIAFAQAFGTYCNGGRVVIGRDSRVSGPMLHGLVTGSLLATGCEVVDLGIAPTPTTQFATEKQHSAGGIILTASHNPVMWNGLKLLAPDGLFLDEAEGAKVNTLRVNGSYARKSWEQLGRLTSYSNAVGDHLQAVLSLPEINVEQIRRRRFKVVADCVNGAGGVIVPQLLEQLGCEAVYLNLEPHGRFPRNPEPMPENLGQLGRAVTAHHADLGLAVDPDADRLALVSEKGVPLGEEYTLALAVDFMLRRKRGKVVANVSTSRVLDDLAAKYGCPLERTKVGEINVARRMREVGAVIGGEGNGGVILPEVHLGRDAVVGIALILQHLSDAGMPLSELNRTLPQYTMCRRKLALPDKQKAAAVLQKLEEIYAHEQMDRLDGIKILRDRSWVQVRASNTEPILRVMSEAPTAEAAGHLCDEIMQALQQ
ncbi:MAG: phosphoglucosamine mutase [candidate division KSB1 bacterium]|nr:phosphoglucosamine mutase [candidate division KSB1 bacterium]MDZ7274668.1 phosphoglucosamine mutase [candidate division KSB1 bacterium]MDZ7285493.1 phosphoglucosamine mutase [candidate division KSB1 bacterium]MDZ7298525.1 phosphoglucosamine mutase [candidate division KSB1 bacterium]MDZ7306251.1 phosphoglucosamine mutase [candidate division KSB1 bacterium]